MKLVIDKTKAPNLYKNDLISRKELALEIFNILKQHYENEKQLNEKYPYIQEHLVAVRNYPIQVIYFCTGTIIQEYHHFEKDIKSLLPGDLINLTKPILKNCKYKVNNLINRLYYYFKNVLKINIIPETVWDYLFTTNERINCAKHRTGTLFAERDMHDWFNNLTVFWNCVIDYVSTDTQ